MKILLALLFFSLPTYAQYAHRSNPGTPGAAAPTIAATGACPSTGCVTLNTGGTSVMMVTITAAGGCPGGNCTLQFACSKDNWATNVAIAADLFSGGSMAGAPATTTTAAGTYLMPTYAFPSCGVLASSYTSGTATVSLDADPAFLPAIGATGAASQQVQGTTPAGSAATGNPVQTGGAAAGGTGNVVEDTVKAASTAPAATDTARVVTVRESVVKGTQGSIGVPTQDLKDSGRTFVTLNADGITASVANTVFTFDKNVNGTVTTGQTTYTITSGKTLRVQAINFSATDTSTVANRVVGYLRLNTAGACVAGSGKVLSCEMSSPSGTIAANEGAMECAIVIPDGLEIVGDGTKAICMSETSTATSATITANLVGFEY